MRHVNRFIACIALGISGLITLPAHAGVIISGTRQVYPAQEPEITVNLTNDDKSVPRLVQAWIDAGNEKLFPDQSDVPFNLSPPVFRMDPGKSQSLRIVYTREPLPTDKESLFWLNVLEVPPKPEVKSEQNALQFAFRIRTKLFFRPAGLTGHVEDAPRDLRWSLVDDGKGKALEVRNPTPYYISFQSVALARDGQTIKSDEADMVAPNGTHRFPLPGMIPAASNAQVRFSTINDSGGFVPFTAPLQP